MMKTPSFFACRRAGHRGAACRMPPVPERFSRRRWQPDGQHGDGLCERCTDRRGRLESDRNLHRRSFPDWKNHSRRHRQPHLSCAYRSSHVHRSRQCDRHSVGWSSHHTDSRRDGLCRCRAVRPPRRSVHGADLRLCCQHKFRQFRHFTGLQLLALPVQSVVRCRWRDRKPCQYRPRAVARGPRRAASPGSAWSAGPPEPATALSSTRSKPISPVRHEPGCCPSRARRSRSIRPLRRCAERSYHLRTGMRFR